MSYRVTAGNIFNSINSIVGKRYSLLTVYGRCA